MKHLCRQEFQDLLDEYVDEDPTVVIDDYELEEMIPRTRGGVVTYEYPDPDDQSMRSASIDDHHGRRGSLDTAMTLLLIGLLMFGVVYLVAQPIYRIMGQLTGWW